MSQDILLPDTAIEMMLGLTEAEIKTLLFILRQTHRQKRESVVLTYANLVNGMIDRDGILVARSTGLCHKSIAGAVRSLRDKGFIVADIQPGRMLGGGAGMSAATCVISIGQRMRPLRPWVEEGVTVLPEPTPFRPRRLKAEVESRLKAEFEARDAG